MFRTATVLATCILVLVLTAGAQTRSSAQSVIYGSGTVSLSTPVSGSPCTFSVYAYKTTTGGGGQVMYRTATGSFYGICKTFVGGPGWGTVTGYGLDNLNRFGLFTASFNSTSKAAGLTVSIAGTTVSTGVNAALVPYTGGTVYIY